MNKITRLNLVFCLVVSVLVSATWAQDADSYALLIQQSPPDGGSVTPGSGVHKMGIGETISLSAIPKPGYRFLYWLGDVSSTATPDTTTQIDSPKMVVAVFTREAYEDELPGVRLIEGASGSGGGGRYSPNPVGTPAEINPGSYYDPGDIIYNFPDEIDDPTDETEDNDIPIPDDDNDDIPVPDEPGNEVPEPATILLMGLGVTALLRRK